VTAGNGNLSTLRRSQGSFVLNKRSRTRLQLVSCDDWHRNTGCLVAQDLALLTKVRTRIHEEISLLTVLYFPFRARTPYLGPPPYAPLYPSPSNGRAAFPKFRVHPSNFAKIPLSGIGEQST
jgi:hypothetical protein